MKYSKWKKSEAWSVVLCEDIDGWIYCTCDENRERRLNFQVGYVVQCPVCKREYKVSNYLRYSEKEPRESNG